MTIKQFKQLEIDRFKADHPTMPYAESFFNSKFKYNDKTANGLTQLVIRYIKFIGGQAERISTTGRMIDNTKVVTNVIGHKYRIGSTEWVKGTGTKGSADISAIIKSNKGTVIPWKIEIKMKDKQSEAQKQYEQSVITAGGQYSIVHSFEEFTTKLETLITTL